MEHCSFIPHLQIAFHFAQKLLNAPRQIVVFVELLLDVGIVSQCLFYVEPIWTLCYFILPKRWSCSSQCLPYMFNCFIQLAYMRLRRIPRRLFKQVVPNLVWIEVHSERFSTIIPESCTLIEVRLIFP